MTKMDYAICLAAALGHLMIHQQDAVGLVVFDEKIRGFLPPRSKRSHLMNILSILAKTRPAARTDLAGALHEVADRVRKRSLIILLSDLLTDQDRVVPALHHLKFRGHDLIISRCSTTARRPLSSPRPTRFEDPETGQTVQADAQAVRAGYLRELTAFLDEYRRQCLSIRADFVTVDNAMNFDKALVQFLAQRKGRFLK